MKKRSAIKEDYKWNLKDIFQSDEEVFEEIKKLEKSVEKIKTYKGKLSDPKMCLDLFKLDDDISVKFANIYTYVMLKHVEDISNQKYVEMQVVVSNFAQKISENSVFIEPELNSLSAEYIEGLINDKRFKNYALSLKELLRNKPHILSEIEEKILTKSEKFAGDFSDIFDNIDNVDLKFEDAYDSNGKKYELNNATFGKLRESKDRVLRESAYKNLMKGFISLSNTIATNYIGSVKSDWFYTDVHGHKSTLDASLFGLNMDRIVYNTLIEKVNETLPLVHKYYALRKKILNLNTLYAYDLSVPLTKYAPKMSFPVAVGHVKKALAIMGEEYVSLVQRSLDERWVDIYPNLNKESGAFSCGSAYSVHPYVKLNHMDNIDGAFTFAHEIGHAIHSYYSNKNNPYTLCHYPIFLAEIASTTNEVLLLKYFYKNAKTKQEKLHFLDEYIRMFTSTIFRQTQFSEFEEYAHKLVEADQPISRDILKNYYKKLNLKYEGKVVKHLNESDYVWLRIPHFYSSFYVFKYATGLTSAVCIASNILNNVPNAKENYFNFLKSGGNDYALNILQRAGVDLTTSRPYEVAFSELKWAINEMKKLAD